MAILDCIKRALFGEPSTDRRWAVFYYDSSLISRSLKFLFGIHGCYRINCDDMIWGPFPVGLVGLVDKKSDSAQYIWILQLESYVCNAGFSEQEKIARARYEEFISENQKVYARSQATAEAVYKNTFESMLPDQSKQVDSNGVEVG
jgi:hypothetical protein